MSIPVAAALTYTAKRCPGQQTPLRPLLILFQPSATLSSKHSPITNLDISNRQFKTILRQLSSSSSHHSVSITSRLPPPQSHCRLLSRPLNQITCCRFRSDWSRRKSGENEGKTPTYRTLGDIFGISSETDNQKNASLLQKNFTEQGRSKEDAYMFGIISNQLEKMKSQEENKWVANLRRLLRVVALGLLAYLMSTATIVSGGGDGVNVFDSEHGEDNEKKSVEIKAVSFDDIQGCDDVKDEMSQIVKYLKDPSSITSLGGRIPKGVLLVGEPGVGKTMLARAVATEAGVPFFHSSGSAFDEVFVGVGSSRVTKLFKAARKAAPSVIFIDEMDAVGSTRSKKLGSQNRQTLNQLLSEMDGFKPNDGVIVIAATNMGKVLDPALTRAGRFDAKIYIHKPDADARSKLFKHYLSKIKAHGDIDPVVLGNILPGWTGASIENLVNQAALRAANTNSNVVTMEHLDWARAKLELGREKANVTSEKNLRNTAYHEAAHALVGHMLKMPNHSATIERRGGTLGHVRHALNEDFFTRDYAFAMIAKALAGKLGEEVAEGEGKHSVGCSSDYEVAYDVAQKFVLLWSFNGRLLTGSQDYELSEECKKRAEVEVKSLLDEANDKARAVLAQHADKHRKLSQELLTKKTLDKAQLEKILC